MAARALRPKAAGEFLKDPVHGEINFAGDTLWLREVCDTPEFARALNIRQLGPTSRFFPGATHTRGAHCLGVYEITRRMLQNHSFSAIAAIDRQTLLAAALLHDVGHGPHSHAFEDYFGGVDARGRAFRPFAHEALSVRLILNPKGSLRPLLEKHGVDPERVAALVDHKRKGANVPPWMMQLVSSELDMDRTDYLLRDSYYAGVAFGAIDANPLLHWAAFDKSRGLIAFADRAIATIENFLVGRYHMYETVYLNEHSALLNATLWFALRRISDLDAQGAFDWGEATACRDVLRVFFAGGSERDVDLGAYLLLTDGAFDTFLQRTRLTARDAVLQRLLDSYYGKNRLAVHWFPTAKRRDEAHARLMALPDAKYFVKKHGRTASRLYAPSDDTQRVWIWNTRTGDVSPLERVSPLVGGANGWLSPARGSAWGLLAHRDFIRMNRVAQRLASAD